ncbi:MAG: hypothetical protein IKN57_06995 [Parasporobacterium sp.]|nr:hypothetical protein [Parasporobacterium sp.]
MSGLTAAGTGSVSLQTYKLPGGTRGWDNSFAYEELFTIDEPYGNGALDGVFGLVDERSVRQVCIAGIVYEASCTSAMANTDGSISYTWLVQSHPEKSTDYRYITQIVYRRMPDDDDIRFLISGEYLYVNWKDKDRGYCTKKVSVLTPGDMTEPQAAEYLSFNRKEDCIFRGYDGRIYLTSKDRSVKTDLGINNLKQLYLIDNTIVYTIEGDQNVYVYDISRGNRTYIGCLALGTDVRIAFNGHVIYAASKDRNGSVNIDRYDFEQIRADRILSLNGCTLKGFRATANFLYLDIAAGTTVTVRENSSSYNVDKLGYAFNLTTGMLYLTQAGL